MGAFFMAAYYLQAVKVDLHKPRQALFPAAQAAVASAPPLRQAVFPLVQAALQAANAFTQLAGSAATGALNPAQRIIPRHIEVSAIFRFHIFISFIR